jgi:single-stranded DNA-binding protein
MNNVTLCGSIADRPKTTYASNTTSVEFSLLVQEQQDGQHVNTFIPCNATGSCADMAKHLSNGDAVIIQGKIQRQSRTFDGHGRGDLEVACRKVWLTQQDDTTNDHDPNF